MIPLCFYGQAYDMYGMMGTDTGGGYTLNMWRAIYYAMMGSKLHWGIIEHKGPPHVPDCVSFSQAFYMATKGGGEFFGKVGSFEVGYDFDAVLIDESRNSDFIERPIGDRIERMISLSDERETIEKYIKGKLVYKRQ